MSLAVDRLHQGDCVALFDQVEPASVDLVFADPPFNIGYDYDVYDDAREADDYLTWCRQWMAGVHRALKPDGTFWLAIGDEYAAELKVLAQRELGFHTRSWVIWYYTFGVNCRRGFSRSHTHLFHFVKDRERFTFNADHPAERLPSARQLVYADARANPAGRLPDNTWILRPQDAGPKAFVETDDTWYFARVAGTFKEREGFHGCQMPERLLGRIIRLCSNPGDTVLDPFSGSGTTLAVAKKLGRRWMGFELSTEYAKRIRLRLKQTESGAELDGTDESPTTAPTTEAGKRRKLKVRGKKFAVPVDGEGEVAARCSVADLAGEPSATEPGVETPPAKRSVTKRPIDRANAAESAGVSEAEGLRQAILGVVDEALGDIAPEVPLTDPQAGAEFLARCDATGTEVEAWRLNRVLWDQALRRVAGKWQNLAATRGPRLSWYSVDQATPAAEIALALVMRELERPVADLFCRPEVTSFFDRWMSSLAPDLTISELRWAAWCVMLERRRQGGGLPYERTSEVEKHRRDEVVESLPKPLGFEEEIDASLAPGVFVLIDSHGKPAYVGATFELAGHLDRWRSTVAWLQLGMTEYHWIPSGDPRPLAARLRRRLRPIWNSLVADRASQAAVH
ncbi:MAG TPA: site-specific DNA-methyltransferase [Pirellulaceae bacterium]|nr:site-specific DNA-methyltransferase [Pirellulaceae bacterium]